MRLREQIEAIQNGLYDSSFGHLYGEAHVLENRRRYLAALENYQHYFQDDEEIRLFSSPGRAEISGNHTDHQHGRVICASVDMDIVSIVRKNPDYCIHLKSEAANLRVPRKTETDKKRWPAPLGAGHLFSI